MRNPALWKRNVQKTRRQSGKSFLSRKNKVILEKNVKAPCTNCIFHCVNIFSDEERNNIFQSFWSLSDDDKNSFYNTFFTRHYAKHRKKNSASYIKKFSYRYYLEKNQTLYRVCRTFFLNTLNIDQKRIYYNFKHLKNNLIGSPLPRKKKENMINSLLHQIKCQKFESIFQVFLQSNLITVVQILIKNILRAV